MFIHGIAVLFVCQFIGEALVRMLNLPVPGPVVGMLLLLTLLLVLGKVPKGVQSAADGLLNHLALLYVPAGVGMMVHFKLVAADWLTITVALVVSTILAMGVTALVLQALTKRGRHKTGEAS